MKTKILILSISVLVLILSFVLLFPKYIADGKYVDIPISIQENKTDIFIAGDIMLDRQVRKRISQFGIGHIFSSSSPVIKDADISIANLEGVITSFGSVSAVDHNILRFTFDQGIGKDLADIGFDALSQANNHDNDFGQEGINQSYDLLKASGIEPFGDYFNHDDKVATFEKNGSKFAFIGWNEFGGNVDSVLGLVQKYKIENYFVIVMPHWGIEYQDQPTDKQKENARKMIDSGADIVVGSHPHVVESIEIYNNKPIFYSLGNFVFDQNFSYGTTHSVALKITKYEDNERILILPVLINDSSPSFMDGKEKQEMLDHLALISDDSLKQEIQRGEIDIQKDPK